MFSVIILTYNSSEHISLLLESLIKKLEDKIKDSSLEVIVADNASTDNTVKIAKQYKQVKVVENGGNVGFAKGNNLAAKKAQGDYLVFLNPDAEFVNGDIFDALNLFETKKDIGIVGGQITSWDGNSELSCGKFYTPFNVLLLALGLEEKFGVRFSPGKEEIVDFVSGGFMMIRKSLFEKLNGFDEDYFMYIEDSDLCFRAKKLGFRTMFSPEFTVRHIGQGSSNKKFAIVNIYKGLVKFNKKQQSEIAYSFVKMMLTAKAVFLVILGKIMNNKNLSETYGEALGALKD